MWRHEWRGLLTIPTFSTLSARAGCLCSSDLQRRIVHALRPSQGFCRIAAITALPTDEEIEKGGFKDAGRYLREGIEETERKKLIAARSRGWGDDPSGLVQPLCRCVYHLIAMCVRSMQDAASRKKDVPKLEMSKKDIGKWASRNIGIADD